MAVATENVIILTHVPNVRRVVITLDPIAANTTGAIETINYGLLEGRLLQVRYHTANVLDTNFSLFSRSTGGVGTIHEILGVDDITQCFQRGKLDILWRNTDDPATDKLYFQVTNQSMVAPTGTVSLELMVRIDGKG